MRPPPAKLLPLLARAAELRAAGASWDAVATELHRAADTCRRWPSLYPDAWRSALHAAERQLLEDAGAEAVLVLRQLLRSETEAIRRDAAKLLLQARPQPDTAAVSAAPWARFVEELSDGEVDSLLVELRPVGASGTVAAPAADAESCPPAPG